VIFLYHGVVPDVHPRERWCMGQALPVRGVDRHLTWLARRFRIVPMSEYVAATPQKRGQRPAAITFDDGGRETFDNVWPILRREGLPATLFVSTGHLCGGPLLWFSYLNALCFEDVYAEVTVEDRRFRLDRLEEKKRARRELGAMAENSHRPFDFVARMETAYPLPAKTLDQYGGMTADQLAAAGKDDLLEVGSHAVAHPYLTRIPAAEQTREISDSKEVLSALTGRPVRYFAYPGGDYDGAVIERVRNAGYEAAFATRPRNFGSARFEIGRVGIYSESIVKLQLKAAGVVTLAERLGVRVG
jgi:peptidoglycan/xylan/chitin deacetylase (PgdA/CDA1 family)